MPIQYIGRFIGICTGGRGKHTIHVYKVEDIYIFECEEFCTVFGYSRDPNDAPIEFSKYITKLVEAFDDHGETAAADGLYTHLEDTCVYEVQIG